MACYMVCLDNDCYEFSNDGGDLKSSISYTSPNTDPIKQIFNEKIRIALDRIFANKPNDFLIYNKNLYRNLMGKIIVNGKDYIATFDRTDSPINRAMLANYLNWKTVLVPGTQSEPLENINIDIIALDAKKSEKKAHFTTLLPTVIDGIFSKIGVSSILKRNTSFRNVEDLFYKISGVVKMDNQHWYGVTFRTSSEDKIGINDFKNMDNWNIEYDVSESVKSSNNPKLFQENAQNTDFSVYKTTLSNLGLSGLFTKQTQSK